MSWDSSVNKVTGYGHPVPDLGRDISALIPGSLWGHSPRDSFPTDY